MAQSTDELNIPPHAPDTRGRVRRFLGGFHVTGVFWYRFHRWGVSILPDWGLWFFTTVFVAFFYLALRRIRSAIASNLECALGPCSWREEQGRIWRTMWSYAWCLSERYESLGISEEAEFEVEGEDRWEQVTAKGEGIVIVTAHIGHWEIGSRLGLAESGRRVHVVREVEGDAKAQEFIENLMRENSTTDYVVHFVDKSEPTLGARLFSALRQGEFVALQGDRPRSDGPTATANLFGCPLELPLGPFALARAAGVPLVPVFIFREGRRRSRVSVSEPIWIRSSDDREADFADGMQVLANEISRAVVREPDQWFCFRELWPEDTDRYRLVEQ